MREGKGRPGLLVVQSAGVDSSANTPLGLITSDPLRGPSNISRLATKGQFNLIIFIN